MKPNEDPYRDFDQALLAQLRAGRNTITQLDNTASGLRELAGPHCRRGLLGGRVPPVRIIDRRLQALRKQGAVRFNGRSWEVVAARL
jgi:hypothetical protein